MYEVPDTHIAWVPSVVVLCSAEAGAIATRLIATWRRGNDVAASESKPALSWEYERDEVESTRIILYRWTVNLRGA